MRLAGLPWRMIDYHRFRCRPVWVTFDVTWNCNCRCEYCNYWKERHEDLPLDQVQRVIEHLRRLGVMYLGISGGEPLLRRDIVDIVECGLKSGMYVGINTNGTVGREETLKALMERGIDTICFSIDGATAATHERFRKNCPFDKVVRSIEAAVRIRNEGQYATQISTNTVVHRGNVDEIEAISRFRTTLGVDRNNFQPVVTADLGDRKGAIAFSAEDQGLLERVKTILKNLPDGNLSGYIDLITDYYAGGGQSRKMACFAGRAFAYVDPAGTLYPCSVLLEPLAKLAGDGGTESLRSPEARAVMHRAAEQRCKGCSLVCYMERNVMLNHALSPRMWRETLVDRYRVGRARKKVGRSA